MRHVCVHVSVRLPEKGPTTGTIIGAIIGVIILLAIIGTAIAMYRKHKSKPNDSPPKHKPPPPKKTNSSANKPVNSSRAPVGSEDRLLESQYYSTQNAEPVTDLDTYQDNDDGGDDNDGGGDREHYHSGAPSGWDDPANNEVPPYYMDTGNDRHGYNQGSNFNRGDSFVSSAMFV